MGKMAVIDGFSGEFYIDPEPEILENIRQKEEQEAQTSSCRAKRKPTVTKGGKAIKLFANIGSVSDLPAAMSNDAGGIGLFRSEFLYLESETYPTEDEQFKAYKMVAETMAGKSHYPYA